MQLKLIKRLSVAIFLSLILTSCATSGNDQSESTGASASHGDAVVVDRAAICSSARDLIDLELLFRDSWTPKALDADRSKVQADMSQINHVDSLTHIAALPYFDFEVAGSTDKLAQLALKLGEARSNALNSLRSWLLVREDLEPTNALTDFLKFKGELNSLEFDIASECHI